MKRREKRREEKRRGEKRRGEERPIGESGATDREKCKGRGERISGRGAIRERRGQLRRRQIEWMSESGQLDPPSEIGAWRLRRL